MPFSGQTQTYYQGTPDERMWFICSHCGAEHTSQEEAEDCCSYECGSCGARYQYEEDAYDCCAFYCAECGERYDSEEEAIECANQDRYDRGEERYDDPYSPQTYPQEILDSPVSYPILIPVIEMRPARLCSLEQELSSGGRMTARLLHDIGIGLTPNVMNYSHAGEAGFAIVKEDGSLPSGGGEVVYSRFNLSDRQQSRNFSEAIWRLRELKRQRLVTTNRQAGTHIHISATSMDDNPEFIFGPKQMASVYEIFSFCEDVIFRLASAGWADHRGTSYTGPLPKLNERGITPARVVQSVRGRYFSLNFTRLLQAAQTCACGACAVGDWQECNCGQLRHGTIEWRVFNASTKPETIHGWLILAHAITAKAFDYQIGSLAEPNGYLETDEERHPWIFSWILNECPMTDIEQQVLIALAKRSPGLTIDWSDFERNNIPIMATTDALDDELAHDPLPLWTPMAQQMTIQPPSVS